MKKFFILFISFFYSKLSTSIENLFLKKKTTYSNLVQNGFYKDRLQFKSNFSDFIEKKLAQNIFFDGLVVIPTTAPLRSVEDINRCIEKFEEGESDIVITITEANRNPYFNMVNLDSNGNTTLLIQNESKFIRRQDSPEVFDVTTVAYVVKPKFVKQNEGIFDGRVKSVIIPKERAVDIDNKGDFEFAEYLVSKNNERLI